MADGHFLNSSSVSRDRGMDEPVLEHIPHRPGPQQHPTCIFYYIYSSAVYTKPNSVFERMRLPLLMNLGW
uniref:Uncharacterized protein n=1 Tax=Anguilla anguilla TaxID=7936 RepID=A0A0E9WK85_ANGAN